MRDLMNSIHLVPAFQPKAAVTDNTAQVSASVDRQGYDSVTLGMVTGTLSDADATFTLLMEESSDNSAWSTVAAADLIGTVALGSFDFAADGVCRKIGYKGAKRYVRATVTPANNTGNLFLAGMWLLGHPNAVPTVNPPV